MAMRQSEQHSGEATPTHQTSDNSNGQRQVIEHRASYTSLTIHEDYLALFPEGNGRSKAIILSILEQLWYQLPPTEYYIALSFVQFEQALYGLCGYNTIVRCLEELVQGEFIERRICAESLASVYEYRLLVETIQDRLNMLPERAFTSSRQHRAKRTRELAQSRRLQLFQGMCAYCGINKATTWDHLVPRTKGGLTVEGNLVPACIPCNSSKGDSEVLNWLQSKQITPSATLQSILTALYHNENWEEVK